MPDSCVTTDSNTDTGYYDADISIYNVCDYPVWDYPLSMWPGRIHVARTDNDPGTLLVDMLKLSPRPDTGKYEFPVGSETSLVREALSTPTFEFQLSSQPRTSKPWAKEFDKFLTEWTSNPGAPSLQMYLQLETALNGMDNMYDRTFDPGNTLGPFRHTDVGLIWKQAAMNKILAHESASTKSSEMIEKYATALTAMTVDLSIWRLQNYAADLTSRLSARRSLGSFQGCEISECLTNEESKQPETETKATIHDQLDVAYT